MRVLLTSNASYNPPRGGSTRSNLIWLAHLAASGHSCRVVCPTEDATLPDTVSNLDGIEIHAFPELSRRAGVLRESIRSFEPDWVLVSSEDLSHVLLREAHHTAPDRIVYLAHTPQWYPFGPASWNPDSQATAIIKDAAGVVAISRAMAAYIEKYSGSTAAVIHPPMYGEPPYPELASFDRGFVLMINPSVVKGISIFLGLAERFPNIEFAGLTGWGTTHRDRELMARLPNARILESVPRIDDALARARLLLMPSLWLEGFGLIAMEAMLRGLPVISSDSGGLVEAKAGTGFVIPIRPIEKFESIFDETHMPKPVDVPQDLEPWADALRLLLTDRGAYEAESRRSREVALEFVSRLRAGELEDYLMSLKRRDLAPKTSESKPDLSAAQRALLLKRLRERR